MKLPNIVYLGFSAETGELSDNFDIISLESRSMYSTSGSSGGSPRSTQASSRRKGGKVYKQTSSGGGWMWFFFKMLMFVGVVVGGYVGWTMYRANRRTRF